MLGSAAPIGYVSTQVHTAFTAAAMRVKTHLVEESLELMLALSDGILDLGDETGVRSGGRSGLDSVGDLSEGALSVSLVDRPISTYRDDR